MSSERAADIPATLQAWREHGAHRLDPVRFHLIEALAGRAARHDGDARRILDARVAELVRQYEARIAATLPQADADAPAAPAPAANGLAELLEHIATHAAAAPATDADARPRSRYPELDLLDYFQATWARLSTDRQLRQSQEQVHENAGPLNSNHLVHRALSLMRDESPGYLHQFLAYLDALSWVDQLNNNGGLAIKPAARARKNPRASR